MIGVGGNFELVVTVWTLFFLAAVVVFGVEVVDPLVGKQPGRRVKLLVALGALFLALVGLDHVVLQVDPKTSLVLEPGQPADRASVPPARRRVRHGGEGVGLTLLL